eukprot:TRINITY_DN77612_c0_g1_i1.p1 TRINITY_DN77612_c0_g1~~TRINITY_DN77612_c0_g1_i1.p1  ORF type:complete len:958 (-),score=113.21 TRINITY_DN77612_c0_g1_i1:133-2610(-)
MASALVDANTLDAIDLARCFSEDVNDVCRLKYWSMPKANKTAANYLNLTPVFQDRLSPQNTLPSVWDCSHPSPKINCFNRSSPIFNDPSLRQRTFGLLPEDPIILDSRLEYPIPSVVPLTPVVWQTRSPRVPCEGFGDRYNTQVLRAGRCHPTEGCDSSSSIGSAFSSSRPALRSGRMQSIFLTYSDDAFFCIDRSKEESAFLDQSWDPWASHTDLKDGRPITPAQLNGKTVFYKFISDVAYLQAPIPNELLIHSAPCDENLQRACQTGGASADCTDPLVVGPSHSVWHADKGTSYEGCTARTVWANEYLSIPKDKWPEKRKNTFLTIETSQLTVAALVITPQMADVQDIVSIVRVTFDIQQSGFVEATPYVTSTSDTKAEWFVVTGFALLAATLYSCFAVRSYWRTLRTSSVEERTLCPSQRLLIFDLGIGIFCAVHIITCLKLELGPPYVTEELLTAFAHNSQDQYFQTFESILLYNNWLQMARQYGFLLVGLLFVRFGLFLTAHPRLSVLTSTILASSDDLLHFFIYMGSIEGFMAFFAYWAFGQDREEYSSFYRVIWTQFRIFIGDFGFDSKQTPDGLYFAYLVSYIFLIFILLLNFLLAIVMKAYQTVQDRLKDNKAEKNVIADVVDIAHTCWRARREGWPSSAQLWKHLSVEPRSELARLPPVTAEELFANLQDSSGQPLFAGMESAMRYISFYSTKVTEAGKHTLLETRRSRRLKPGRSFGDGLAEEGWLDARSNPDSDSDNVDDDDEFAGLTPRFKMASRPARRRWSKLLKSQLTALPELVQDEELGVNDTKAETLHGGPKLLGRTASSKVWWKDGL